MIFDQKVETGSLYKNIFDEEIEFIIFGFKYRRLILNNGILFFFLAILIKYSKYSTKRKIRLMKLFDIFYLASTKGSLIKFSKIIAKSRK